MNPFSNPTNAIATELPREVTVTKQLRELGQSHSPVLRLRQFSYFEFGDKSRISNVVVFEALLTRLEEQLGQECKLALVEGNNIKKAEDGFETAYYLAGFEAAGKAYALDSKMLKTIQSGTDKLVLSMRLLMFVCIFFAVMSIPLMLAVVGFFTFGLSVFGFMKSRSGIKKFKHQQQIFEKLGQVANAIPNAHRYSI